MRAAGALLVAAIAMADQHALDDAAAAALWALRGANKEHLGLLFEQAGIQRTDPVASGSSRRASGKFAIPAGSLRAIFHNHPGAGKSNSRFSPKDVEQAHALGVPSYIVDESHEIRRYTPGPSVPDSFAFQRGEPVLAQFPIDEFKRQLYAKGLLR